MSVCTFMHRRSKAHLFMSMMSSFKVTSISYTRKNKFSSRGWVRKKRCAYVRNIFFFPPPWNSHSDDRAVIRSVLLRIYCALRRVSAGAHGLKKKKTKNLFLKCRSPQLLQSRPCESHRTAAEEREKKKENKKKTSTWNLIIVMKWLYFVNSTWKKFFV